MAQLPGMGGQAQPGQGSIPMNPLSGAGLAPSVGNVPSPAASTIGPVTTMSAPSVNPYASTTATPSVPLTGTTASGVNPIYTTGGIQQSPVNWTTGDYSVVGDFQDTYGQGTGTAITDVLKNLGTTNDAAVQATINNIMAAANRGYGNIQAQQAASGISADSSTAALAGGDYWSQVNTGLQSTIAGMENQQQNTLLATLLGEGQQHGGDSSGWDVIGNILGNAGSSIGDIASFFSGGSNG